MDINELNEQIAKHEKWLDMDFMLKYKNNTFTHENDKANGMLCLENECFEKIELDNEHLCSSRLYSSVIYECSFTDCCFKNIDFFGTFFGGSKFTNCYFENCNYFSYTHLTLPTSSRV